LRLIRVSPSSADGYSHGRGFHRRCRWCVWPRRLPAAVDSSLRDPGFSRRGAEVDPVGAWTRSSEGGAFSVTPAEPRGATRTTIRRSERSRSGCLPGPKIRGAPVCLCVRASLILCILALTHLLPERAPQDGWTWHRSRAVHYVLYQSDGRLVRVSDAAYT